MRVVGGQARGRRLKSPQGRGIRPTADRIRESIFDLLGPGPHAGRVLDLFAGTGALGIEALSRGFSRAVFVEQDRTALALVRENLSRCSLATRARVEAREVLSFLRGLDPEAPFALVLLDPPYRLGLPDEVLRLLGEGSWVEAEGRVVVECEAKLVLPERRGSLELAKRKHYSEKAVLVYAAGALVDIPPGVG